MRPLICQLLLTKFPWIISIPAPVVDASLSLFPFSPEYSLPELARVMQKIIRNHLKIR
jgi:hypothetical protein